MKKFYLGLIAIVSIFISVFGVYKVTAIKNEVLPELFIKAINPGYTIDGVSNVGEMIEIKKNSVESVSLAGATVGYTNSVGNYSVLYEFPEDSWITGESILLRLASSPDSELAAVNYTKTIAFKAELDLRMEDKVIDKVCWTSKEGCYKEFKSAKPTTLVRDEETGEFSHLETYEPSYNNESYHVDTIKEEEGYGEIVGHCKGLEFSEILSYYETAKTEQFIEIHNSGTEQVLLDGCAVRYKGKDYLLNGIVGADGYFVYNPVFSLTKNPVNSNRLDIIDVNGEIIDTLVYPNGQRKGTAFALIGYDNNGAEIWRTTYAVTSGSPNIFQEFKTCEEGKVINKATGNCVKVTSVAAKICPEGQYLNILTGRCKKNVTESEKKCKEGYFLNLETGRCRKIKENTGANYNIAPEKYEEKSSFVALYIVLGVIGLGLVYLVYEFRHEIVKLWRKVFR